MNISIKPETSIVIRTRNEEQWIGVVLEKLLRQTYKNFEIIIVDSGSTDKTLEIAKKFPVKILEIPFERFSYPYALNFGIDQAKADRFIVMLSAHSLPISDNWLENGILNFSRYEKIMGVYGPVRALPGTSFWDKFFLDFLGGIKTLFQGGNKFRNFLVDHPGQGAMGFTNAIILKELWDKRKLNEEYGAGGEDGEWAGYWFAKGYKAVKDYKFTVRHSHNLGLLAWREQSRHWRSLDRPAPFNTKNFSFRDSETFK